MLLDASHKLVLEYLAVVGSASTNRIAIRCNMEWVTARKKLRELLSEGFIMERRDKHVHMWMLNREEE